MQSGQAVLASLRGLYSLHGGFARAACSAWALRGPSRWWSSAAGLVAEEHIEEAYDGLVESANEFSEGLDNMVRLPQHHAATVRCTRCAAAAAPAAGWCANRMNASVTCPCPGRMHDPSNRYQC